MGWLPGSGCVLWIQMDERQRNKAYDLSGFGNHGTIIGAQWKRGKIGFALHFDGVDDYVKVNHNPTLSLYDEVTIEAWIYLKGDNSVREIVGKLVNYDLRKSTKNELRFVYQQTGTFTWYTFDSVWTIPFNEWHHVVAVYSYPQGFLKFYVDGKLTDTFTTNIFQLKGEATEPLRIGSSTGTAEFWDGLIDEVRIYNRVLSAEEIKIKYWYGVVSSLRPQLVPVR